MKINMNHLPIGSICQMEEFLKSNRSIAMEITEDKEKYEFIRNVLFKTKYRKIKRKEKKTVLEYLKFLTKYSQSHLKNLISKWKLGILFWNPSKNRNSFPVKYLASDIAETVKYTV